MERNKLNPSDPQSRDQAALQWACDLLSMEGEDQAIRNKKTSDQAIVSFFNDLKANHFHTPQGSAQAVELLHGKPAEQLSEFVQHHRKQQFQQIDEIVGWFASQMGEQDHPQLIASLKGRLSAFNAEASLMEVKRYAKSVWVAAQSVQSPVDESNLAVKKILQALFHISTICSTQRRRVRNQHVQSLQREFFEEELDAARDLVWLNYQVPEEKLHRPFLAMLTDHEESIQAYQTKKPAGQQVESPSLWTFNRPMGDAYVSSEGYGTESYANQKKAKRESIGLGWVALLMFFSLGTAIGLFSGDPGTQTYKPIKRPSANFDVKSPFADYEFGKDPEADAKLLALMTLLDVDNELPSLEEFKATRERAEEAKKRVEEAKRRAEEAKKRNEEAKKRNEVLRKWDEEARKRVEERRKRVEEAEQRFKDIREANEKRSAAPESKFEFGPQQPPKMPTRNAAQKSVAAPKIDKKKAASPFNPFLPGSTADDKYETPVRPIAAPSKSEAKKTTRSSSPKSPPSKARDLSGYPFPWVEKLRRGNSRSAAEWKRIEDEHLRRIEELNRAPQIRNPDSPIKSFRPEQIMEEVWGTPRYSGGRPRSRLPSHAASPRNDF